MWRSNMGLTRIAYGPRPEEAPAMGANIPTTKATMRAVRGYEKLEDLRW